VIDRNEILELAGALKLLPSIVEKDYVLGWLLAGIDVHPVLGQSWVFKGGTCLKKCYFETYRFSEDLDFTLQDAGHLEEEFLINALGQVVEWVATESGLTLPAAEIRLDFYENPRGRRSCQGRIAYRGPVSPPGGGWPKIKLDLTADERLVLAPARNDVFHPYSDRPVAGIRSQCYAYEEAFAEKVRALGERTRPRDLYDVVNLYRHGDSRPAASVLRDVLRQKCEYKAIKVPRLADLEPHMADLKAMWENMLAHQLPILPPIEGFLDELPEIFSWIEGEAEFPQRLPMALAVGDSTIRDRVLPLAIPLRARAPLEIIRFAAANRLCIDLAYGGGVRRIEPYSLRRTSEGNYLLHAVRRSDAENRSYRIDRIESAVVTNERFQPRHLIELTSSGPQPVPQVATRNAVTWQSPQSARAGSKGHRRSGPIYIFRCPVCQKTFERASYDGGLNPHKNRQGYGCAGRTGQFVKQRS